MQNSPWERFDLNPLLIRVLNDIGFTNPTDVQYSTLPYYKYRSDLIVSSKTGSGKTLCFVLPVMSDLMNELGLTADFKEGDPVKAPKREHVRCIIMTPTRELAIQIKSHFEMINKITKKYIKVGVIVGGLAKEKQERILGRQPQVVIATPGRLWDLLDSDYNPFLRTLRKTNYLILDEADKMIEMGQFKELDSILDFIYSEEKTLEENLEYLENHENHDFEGDFFIKGQSNEKISLLDPRINLIRDKAPKGSKYSKDKKKKQESDEVEDEHKDDIEDEAEEKLEGEEEWEAVPEDEEGLSEEQLATIEEGDDEDEEGDDINDDEPNLEVEDEDDGEENDEDEAEEDNGEVDIELDGENGGLEIGGDEDEDQIEREEDYEEEDEEEDGDKKSKKKNKKPRQANTGRRTIVLSATLANRYDPRSKKTRLRSIRKNKNKKGKRVEKEQEIKGVEDKTYKLDLLVKKIKFNGVPKLIDLTKDATLPEQLVEYKSLCAEEEKILYLYHILEKHPNEKFIVFANAISGVKRIHSILSKIGLNVVCLYSEQQQRQRIKKLEQYTEGKYNILVCTDVASRGLDIPTVNYVVHYQTPRDPDTYVHRSGRTARIGRAGTTYALIGPEDKRNYLKICRLLNREKGIESLDLSLKQMDEIRELVFGAVKLESTEHNLRRKEKNKDWFIKNAKRADMDLDDATMYELNILDHEITKKRKILKDNQVHFKKVREETRKNQLNPRKGKEVFLDPSKIAEIAKQLQASKNQASQKGSKKGPQNERSASPHKPRKLSKEKFKKNRF